MLASPLGAVTQERLVTVKTADVKATYDFATSDEFIAAALNKIESAVFQGGVKVTIKNFDKEVELSEDHLNVIATDWDTAAKKLNRDLAMFGYAPVRPIRHPSRPKEFLFHVPPWSKYELQFVESSQAPRRYFVHYLDATYPAATLAELLDTDGAGPPKRTKTLANPVSVFDASIVQMQANEVLLFLYPIYETTDFLVEQCRLSARRRWPFSPDFCSLASDGGRFPAESRGSPPSPHDRTISGDG